MQGTQVVHDPLQFTVDGPPEPEFTGLLDQDGNKIFVFPSTAIGFLAKIG